MAASCAPSAVAAVLMRASRARIVVSGTPDRSKLPNSPRSAAGTAISDRPTPRPPREARLRSSCVASPARARSLASPAPAAPPSVAPAAIPAGPNGARAKNGAVEPSPSPSVPPTMPSRPIGTAKRSLALAPRLRIPSRAGASNRSGSRVAAPNAAVSPSPTAPRGMPRKNSPICAPTPVLGSKSSPNRSWYWPANATSCCRRAASMRCCSSAVGVSPAIRKP